MRPDEVHVVGADGLDAIIRSLKAEGWEVWAPVVRDRAIVPGRVSSLSELPAGFHDEQEAGRYKLYRGAGDEVFGWAVGPCSWKSLFFPPSETVWRASRAEGPRGVGPVEFGPGEPAGPERVALIGMRPCEVAALALLDAVLYRGPVPDPDYGRRRRDALLVEVECGAPADTCFCTSMGTGPAASGQADVAVTELGCRGDGDHRFLMRAGSERGASLIGSVPATPATDRDIADRDALLSSAASRIRRRLDADGARDLLPRNMDSPHWHDVADRCLACGNCTLVCPTCFCSDVRDTSDLRGGVARERVWASCFDLGHSYLHGGPVRRSRESRYRQWATHKLSTWYDQFGASGCVGCGRCITWCPVAIDITAEVAAIAAGDAADGSGDDAADTSAGVVGRPA